MKVLGGIFLGCGILIAALSGLCSLAILGGSMFGGSSGESLDGLGVVLMFGGIPFLGGLAIVYAGRQMLKSESGNPPPPPAHYDGTAVPARKIEDGGEDQ